MSYGNMIGAFAGDFVRVPYYQALAGYDSGPGTPQSTQTVKGIFQCVERKTKDSNGQVVTVREMKLWSRSKLMTGWFVRDNKESIVYRVARDNSWREEGGFTVYGLTKVEGDDGNATKEPTTPASVGTGDFA